MALVQNAFPNTSPHCNVCLPFHCSLLSVNRQFIQLIGFCAFSQIRYFSYALQHDLPQDFVPNLSIHFRKGRSQLCKAMKYETKIANTELLIEMAFLSDYRQTFQSFCIYISLSIQIFLNKNVFCESIVKDILQAKVVILYLVPRDIYWF